MCMENCFNILSHETLIGAPAVKQQLRSYLLVKFVLLKQYDLGIKMSLRSTSASIDSGSPANHNNIIFPFATFELL